MTRTRLAIIAGIFALLAGTFFAVGRLGAAPPVDTLNPSVPSAMKGPNLKQPIAYSHAIHVGQLGMDCLYCHTNVDKSPVANIPNVETCMNCHKYVKRRHDQTIDSPEIAKLAKYYDDNKTIPWVHVHWLPDHVGFNHKRHVLAGVRCATCHGDVSTMPIIHQVVPLSMGFCVTCHKANRENTAHPANLDCYTCHK
jgi:hypothetical protein